MPETKSFDIDQLSPSIQRAVSAIPKSDRYFVALSGGLDSMALITFALPFLLKTYQASIEIIHVHHGLSPFADKWAEHCLKVGRDLGLVCHVERVNVVAKGKGLEAAAREARYAVFDRYLAGGGVLLQGHHQDDQAETVLLRLLRGAGPEGLSGIPQQRALAAGSLFRPWLYVSRSELEAEIYKRSVKWVEDESNVDVRFDRNYLRHEILPLLAQRWPNVLNSLSRTAARSEESHQQLVSWCASEMQKMQQDQALLEQAIDLNWLAKYTCQQQRFLVRYWFDNLNVEHPAEKVFERIWSELIPAENDALPALRWGRNHLRRYNGALFYLDESDVAEQVYEYSLFENEPGCADRNLSVERFEIGGRTLTACYQSDVQDLLGKVLIRPPLKGEVVIVRSRRGGESVVLAGSAQNKALKKLLQAKKVSPWRRVHLPLVFYGDTLALVILGQNQYIVAEGFQVADAAAAIAFSWV